MHSSLLIDTFRSASLFSGFKHLSYVYLIQVCDSVDQEANYILIINFKLSSVGVRQLSRTCSDTGRFPTDAFFTCVELTPALFFGLD